MRESPILSRRRFLQGVGLAGAAFAAAPLVAACTSKANQLRFLNWQDYIASATLPGFTDATGVSVSYQTYVSNDDLEKLLLLANAARRRGREASTYDLVVPSDNFVRRFLREDLLATLDHANIPNLKNLRPEFRQEGFDPGNAYTVPWATGSTGIGYDTRSFPSPPGWDVFLDESLKGRMTVLEEVRDAFACALFGLGKDPNTTSADDVNAAADRLIAMKKVILSFDSATYLDGLATGTLVAAQAYSSDLLEAKQRNPNLDFVIPPEGGGRWVDSLAMPKGALDPANALRFIDYYLEPSVSAGVANAVKVDTGNAAADSLLAADVKSDPTIFPSADVLARLVFTADLGDAEKLYQDGWQRVQGAPA